MHFHCEIVMPPTDDVEKAVATVLGRFQEGDEGEGSAFWDWYVIGGRFAGSKSTTKLGQSRVDDFYAWLKSECITVSGMQAGKQSLSPASQIPIVDAKWRELFPEWSGPCPLFAHSNNQYGEGLKAAMPGDVCTLDDAPLNQTMERVLFCGPDRDGKLHAWFMVIESVWNGVNHMKTEWDGTLGAAIKMASDHLGRHSNQFHAPNGDWICVTVDCHN